MKVSYGGCRHYFCYRHERRGEWTVWRSTITGQLKACVGSFTTERAARRDAIRRNGELPPVVVDLGTLVIRT